MIFVPDNSVLVLSRTVGVSRGHMIVLHREALIQLHKKLDDWDWASCVSRLVYQTLSF